MNESLETVASGIQLYNMLNDQKLKNSGEIRPIDVKIC